MSQNESWNLCFSKLISTADVLATPLTRKIEKFSRFLLVVILGLAGVTFLVGSLRGKPAFEMFINRNWCHPPPVRCDQFRTAEILDFAANGWHQLRIRINCVFMDFVCETKMIRSLRLASL